MANFGGFLSALGQAFGGYAQDQNRKQQLSQTDFDRDFALRRAGYLPSSSPAVATGPNAMTVPFAAGPAQTYNFDYDQSPQGQIERRQLTRLSEQDDATAARERARTDAQTARDRARDDAKDAARVRLQQQRYHALKNNYPDEPAVQRDFDPDMDYTSILAQRDQLARIAVRPRSIGSTRDPNISAASATGRAITDNDRQAASVTKSIPSFAPLSINPVADSASVIARRTPPLVSLGNLAARADSLRQMHDLQSSAIGRGTGVPNGVDVSGTRAMLADATNKLQFLMSNPSVSLADKAAAQDAYRARVQAIMSGGQAP